MQDRQDPRNRNARVQDRRTNSRVSTYIGCSFEWAGVTTEATLIDLSLTGALVNSRNVPPVGTEVVLLIEIQELGKPVSIPSRVVRGGWFGDRGEVSQFAVRFNKVMTDVLRLVSALASRASTHSSPPPSK